jgi:hypothetical protein
VVRNAQELSFIPHSFIPDKLQISTSHQFTQGKRFKEQLEDNRLISQLMTESPIE